MLRATTACTFSTSQLPKVVRHWCVLYILTWKCASRHNGVHFFISHLASWVRTRRFSEPTFRPSGATNHWKNTVNRDFPTFSRICIFFLLIFSLLTLLTSAFQLSILSEVSLLNFLRLVEMIPKESSSWVSVPRMFQYYWFLSVIRQSCQDGAARRTTPERPKVLRTPQFFTLLTWKCASRHKGVHFFDISTSKSGPNMRCFAHVYLEMCFALQGRALFQHLNCQKWSEPGVFCAFWLGHVLRATTACNFLSLIWPHRSAPAALASLLFDPPEPQIIGKTQCFATFLPFRAPGSFFFGDFLFLIFFLLLFSSLTLPISAFHLSILSEVWLPNFLRSSIYFVRIQSCQICSTSF